MRNLYTQFLFKVLSPTFILGCLVLLWILSVYLSELYLSIFFHAVRLLAFNVDQYKENSVYINRTLDVLVPCRPRQL